MGKQLEFTWEENWTYPTNYIKPKFRSQQPLKKKLCTKRQNTPKQL